MLVGKGRCRRWERDRAGGEEAARTLLGLQPSSPIQQHDWEAVICAAEEEKQLMSTFISISDTFAINHGMGS